MKTTGILKNVGIDAKKGKPVISLILDNISNMQDIEKLRNVKKLHIELKKEYKHRSLDANRYFWKLLGELCDELKLNEIEEYKRRVKELGIFRQFKIEKDNISTFEKMWTAQGIAWFCEIFDTTYIENMEFKITNAYYGSSSYNSRQMSRLIDNLVQDCKSIGIETEPKSFIDKLLKEWGEK